MRLLHILLDDDLIFYFSHCRPVMVMQIVKSQAAPKIAEQADPCFIMVHPLALWSAGKISLATPEYTEGLFTPGVDDYTHYLTVMVPVGKVDGEYVVVILTWGNGIAQR